MGIISQIINFLKFENKIFPCPGQNHFHILVLKNNSEKKSSLQTKKKKSFKAKKTILSVQQVGDKVLVYATLSKGLPKGMKLLQVYMKSLKLERLSGFGLTFQEAFQTAGKS